MSHHTRTARRLAASRDPTAIAGLRLAPTGAGSTHHRDAHAAVSTVLAAYLELPFWPQLPNRSPSEAMAPQAGLALQGARWDGRRLHWSGERVAAPSPALLPPPDRAAGLHAFLARLTARPPDQRPPFAKGQLIGPVTLNACIADPPSLTTLGRWLGALAAAQVSAFDRLGMRPLIVFDEPLLARVGEPAPSSVTWDDALAALHTAFTPVKRAGGLAGLHCCASANWTRALAAEPDIIHFDATPSGLGRFLDHREALRAHLARGGGFGWGVWPTDAAAPPFNLSAGRTALLAAADALADAPTGVASLLRRSTLSGVCGTAGFTSEREEQLAANLQALAASLREQ
ncbi:MAG: hypothetical protein OXG19_10005, partial [Chloroflexi bacterium]|nr:hypothetical protein [Chloroflexota bacterium]